MAMPKKELERWLSTLEDETWIAIDDGGLAIVDLDSDAYIEIGGVPEVVKAIGEKTSGEVSNGRPELDSTAAYSLLCRLLDEWGEAVDDSDADIAGSDAVASLCDFVRAAQDIVRRKDFKGELKI
jgi:hypothetical protein